MAKKSITAFTDDYLKANAVDKIFGQIYREASFVNSCSDREDLFFQFFLDEQFEPGAAQTLARSFVEKMKSREDASTRQ